MAVKSNKDKTSPTGMLTVKEVARLLRVHPNTVRRWSKIGVLKAYRIGKRRDHRFRPEDIEVFLLTSSSSHATGS